jgi:protein ImuB
MLWIGLHLPLLSLESFAFALPPNVRSQPLVLLDNHVVARANASAQGLGVQPGMKRVTALALVPQLHIGQADASRDAQALASVAHVALAFTPSVTLEKLHQLEHPDHHQVLMEVQGSLRYFGGLDVLVQRLRKALAPLGHRVCVTSAPTAHGAALLARWVAARSSQRIQPPAKALHCTDMAALQDTLASAPAWLLDCGRGQWDALQGMGLRTLDDLRRLPRAGLARRFGADLLDEIDRAWGERPDPRRWVVLPPVFETRLELFARADTTAQVLQGAVILLDRLVAWAQAHHARVRKFVLTMRHEVRHRHPEDSTETQLEIALAEPSRDAAHLHVLLREHLGHLQLVASTLELQLHCDDIAHSPPPNQQLFPTPGREGEGLVRLIERLQARLGSGQVQRLVRVRDHRPEQACQVRPAEAKDIGRAKRRSPSATEPPAEFQNPAPRPVWLLREPQPLAERRHVPLLDGQPLQLLCGPERIESGWWDGALVERDYFIAQQADGALVWLFRGRLPLSTTGQEQGWYLQGRFA